MNSTIVLKQTPILDLFRLIFTGQLRFDVRVSFILLKKLIIIVFTPLANAMIFCLEFIAFTLDFFGGRQLIGLPLTALAFITVLIMIFS